MSDDRPGRSAPVPRRRAGEAGYRGRPTVGDLLDVAHSISQTADQLRDDFRERDQQLREDQQRMESRLVTAIQDLRGDFEGWTVAHARIHDGHDTWSQRAYQELVDRVSTIDIAQARKEGALGLGRWLIEILGRNWQVLAIIVTALLAILGNIHVNLGLTGS